MTPTDPARDDSRSLLLVVGAGRSGTSLFTGLTQRLGMHVPQPEVLANTSNPKGFGEPRWAVDFHQQLLRSVDVTPEDARPAAWEITARVAGRERAQDRLRAWLTEQLELGGRVVVKDPRLTWFLPLYAHVAQGLDVEPRVVSLLRHPAAGITSRQLAYGAGSTDVRRLAGWLNMTLFLEQRTRELPRAYVAYDDLLVDWRSALTTAEEGLGLSLLSDATDEQRAGAGELVDVSLRRAAPDWSVLDVPADLRDLGQATFEAMTALCSPAAGRAHDQALTTLDDLRSTYTEYYSVAESVAQSSVAAARARERRKRNRRGADEAAPAEGGASSVRETVTRLLRRRPSGAGRPPTTQSSSRP